MVRNDERQFESDIEAALKVRRREEVLVMVAFSGAVEDPPKSGVTFTEESMNHMRSGKPVKESQTKAVFREEGSILIVSRAGSCKARPRPRTRRSTWTASFRA